MLLPKYPTISLSDKEMAKGKGSECPEKNNKFTRDFTNLTLWNVAVSNPLQFIPVQQDSALNYSWNMNEALLASVFHSLAKSVCNVLVIVTRNWYAIERSASDQTPPLTKWSQTHSQT